MHINSSAQFLVYSKYLIHANYNYDNHFIMATALKTYFLVLSKAPG